ncbi:hypothetical protein EYF80_030819 [Liparis tanakae]|uniref:Uncharacterized protein n=1 Tax=Liparis tanakae TaxID=230148 RepID=A0A4Z2H0X3_9TELE|nr:hypothetical protein EYF80_030819 [Liparis tanakae]
MAKQKDLLVHAVENTLGNLTERQEDNKFHRLVIGMKKSKFSFTLVKRSMEDVRARFAPVVPNLRVGPL